MANLNPNSTGYFHSYEPNTNDLTMAMEYDALGQPVIRTAITSRLVPTANSAFGESIAVPLVPVVQIEPVYGIDPDEVQTYTAGGGVADVENNMFHASSTSTLGSYGVLRSRRVIRYRPGQGVMCRFTAMFNPAEGNSLRAGFGSQQEALQVGFDGTEFGIYHVYGNKAEIRTLTITGTSAAGDATVVLNGVSYIVALVNGETSVQTAARIARATFTGWLVEQKDNEVRFLHAGTGPLTGTFSYTGAGGTTGTFVRTQAGLIGTTDFIPRSQFSLDPLDGTGTSGVTIDFTKLNVFQINFRWLGAGVSQFAIEHPDTGALFFFHKIHWVSRQTRPWVDNPNMKFTWTAYNTGGATGASVYGASAAGFEEGVLQRNNYGRSYSLQKSSLGSGIVHQLFTLYNPLTYAGRINMKEVLLTDITVAHQGNDPLQVMIFFEANLATGTQVYTRLPETVPIVSTTTGTVDLNTYTPVVSFVLGINGNQQFDLQGYRFVIPPGQRATICVKSGQNISQISSALSWISD